MDGAERASVFLLAQNRLVREALSKVLHKTSDLTVVGSHGLSPSISEEVILAAPDVLIMDSYSRGSAGRGPTCRAMAGLQQNRVRPSRPQRTE